MTSVNAILLVSMLLTVPPGEDFAGARTIAMGNASRGLALANDAIFLNPAGMAIARRYSLEFNYLHRLLGKVAYPSLSVVDSQTSALAAGLAYSWERGIDGTLSNHRVYLALAYPLGQHVAIGLSAKYAKIGDSILQTAFSAFTGDVGLILSPSGGWSIGVVGYNLIVTEEEQHLPILVGAGLGYSAGRLSLAGDFVANPSDKEDPRFRYHLGGEYILGGNFPLRLGWQKDDDTQRHRWSAGLGYLTQGGAFEIAYRQDAHRPSDRELVLGLRLFL